MNALLFNRLIKTRRMLFGLPVTVAAALLPYAIGVPTQSCGPVRWLLIVVAYVSGRTSGMAFNELIDRHIDEANPRTRHRVLPTRAAKPAEVAILAWTFLALFLLACLRINWLTFALSPLAAFLIWGYAYTKRFTVLCHFFLGLIHLFNPVMAWVAVTGSLGLTPLYLGVALFCSISAQDILYALQDRLFDEGHGVWSIPVRLGQSTSVHLAKALHALGLLALVTLGVVETLHWSYFVGVGALAFLLIWRYRGVKDPLSLGQALTVSNDLVGLLVFGSVLAAWLMGR